MSELQYTYSATLGDWTHDGHEKTNIVYFKSNRDKNQLFELRKLVDNTFGDYDRVDEEDEYREVPKSMIQRMKELDWYDDEWFNDPDPDYTQRYVSAWDCSYMELLFNLMLYHDRDFQWEHIQDPVEDSGIRGGYGLFY